MDTVGQIKRPVIKTIPTKSSQIGVLTKKQQTDKKGQSPTTKTQTNMSRKNTVVDHHYVKFQKHGKKTQKKPHDILYQQ